MLLVATEQLNKRMCPSVSPSCGLKLLLFGLIGVTYDRVFGFVWPNITMEITNFLSSLFSINF